LAEGVDPETGHRETAAGIRQAIGRLRTGKLRPFKPTLPMTVTIQMTTIEIANKAATRPGVRRIDDHTVEARVARQCDIVKWIRAGLDAGGLTMSAQKV
jgi:D-aminopeptidase